jgi:phage terminase large subunit-like protein
MAKPLTRGERVIRFIETFCFVPEGKLVGQPMVLELFQKKWILDTYDNPHVTYRSILSIARKNGKSALIAAIVLAHLVGPEAQQNSQIISGARSRDQAAIIFKLAVKMIRLNPKLEAICRITTSKKTIHGLPMNVEFQSISAEAGTAHGLSPVVAILDETGQVKGPYDAFVEAIETAQGAHDSPLLITISTQAATDADLLSVWIDDALKGQDPGIVCHLYAADEDCDILDPEQWQKANPALGVFRSLPDLEKFAKRASRMPTSENSFRWLFLNQRVEATAPFISRGQWKKNNTAPVPFDKETPLYCGLDLSDVADLTSFVAVAWGDDKFIDVVPHFWLPGANIKDRAKSDRVPYDVWEKEGYLAQTPGKTVEYRYIAEFLKEFCSSFNVKKIAFDAWNLRHLRPWLREEGFSEEELEGDEALFEPFGQGFKSMSPALRDLESDLLNEKIRHGGHPVLTMCAANAVVVKDPAGNKKLTKDKSRGRIDGMVALAMARAVMATYEEDNEKSFWEDDAA